MLLADLKKTLPSWMLTAPREHWSQLMAAPAAVIDALGEAVHQARLAALPGQIDVSGFPGLGGYLSTDALVLTGRDRRVRRGFLESDSHYAGRQREWLEAWARSATPKEMLDQLAAILGPLPPNLRLIESNGTWWTRYRSLPMVSIRDGTIDQWTQAGTGFRYDPTTGDVSVITDVPHLFDWDSISVPAPPLQNDPAKFFLVIYAPCNGANLSDTDHTGADPGTGGDYALTPGVSGAGLGPDAGTGGSNAPRKLVDLVRALVQEWRSAGLLCQYVIVSFDHDAFDPIDDSTPTSIPDGKWGWHTWYDVGTNTQLPSRFPNAIYWSGIDPITL